MIIVTVVAVVLLVAAFLYFFGRRFWLELLAAAHTVPETITLEPVQQVNWPDPDGNRRLFQAILGLGFRQVMPFRVPQMPGVELIGFFHPTEPAYAVLYWHPQAGRWMDICCHYQDGGSLTVSNAASVGALDRMPGRELAKTESQDPAELWAIFKARRRRAPTNPTTAENFPSDFERAYAEEMAWRKGRGGATEDEVRRVAAQSGMVVTEEQVRDTVEVERIKAGKK